MRISKHHIALLVGAMTIASLSSCQSDMSNKEERNAIKSGNKLYDKHDFKGALDEYDYALAANHKSEVALYDKAMARYMSGDLAQMAEGDSLLQQLAKTSTDPAIVRSSLYNLGTFNSVLGDRIKEEAQKPENSEKADTLNQISTATYRKAIEYFKELLKKQPNDMKAIQNLRITQLKLPPESQNQDNNQQQQQQQQQNQDNQDQQNQEQQPQPQQSKQDKNDEQILNSVQSKENQTRKNQKPEGVGRGMSDKPW